MGIKGLLDLIRKKCPQVIRVVHISQFRGSRVAIDMPIMLHKYISASVKEVVSGTALELEEVNRAKVVNLCTRKTLNKLISLQKYDITPVLIADGTPRQEKNDTIVDRSNAKKEREEKIGDLLTKVKAGEAKADELKKMYCSHVYLTKTEVDSIYSVMANLGYPCIRAKHDSEQLGASLAIEGFVSTVWSTDSDCLAFGSPSYIFPLGRKELTEVKGNWPTKELFHEIKLRDVLLALEISFDQFKHICIMAGCDYNSNIPGHGVGKALAQLKTNAPVKASPEAIIALNYERCQEIFRTRVWENVSDDPEKAKMDFNKEMLRFAQRVFSSYGMEDVLTEFLRVVEGTNVSKKCQVRPPNRTDL